MERIFNNFIGILFGPTGLPVFNKPIISDISYAVEGAKKLSWEILVILVSLFLKYLLNLQKNY